MRRLAVLAVAGILLVATPHAAASQYGLPECNSALPGSAVLTVIQAQAVPLVCEARPSGAPSYATGYWDGAEIHLWVTGIDDRNVRKIAAHELGHWFGSPTLIEQWTQLRGRAASDPNRYEDFAEMFSLVNFPESGIGYSYYFGPLTNDQRSTMHTWWVGESIPVVVQIPSVTQPDITAPSTPAAVAVAVTPRFTG